MMKDGSRFFSGLAKAVFRNISCCKEFVETVQTCYGPNGMNKMSCLAPTKCHVLHLGRNNPKFDYTMGADALGEAEWEKDLGVIVHNSLRPSLQCAKAAKKANAVLGQLIRGVTYRDKVVFTNLYKTFVRPIIEYCACSWSPWTEGDKNVLEAVQKRAVKAISNLRTRTSQWAVLGDQVGGSVLYIKSLNYVLVSYS